MPFAVIPQARLSIGLKFKTLGIIGMIANVFGAAVTLGAAYAGYGSGSISLWRVRLAFSLARVCALNVAAGFFRSPTFEWGELGPLFRFSATILLDRTLWYAYSQADSILVGRLLGARGLGVYSIAMQLASIPMERAAEILSSVALPAFSSINPDLDRIGSAYLKGLRIGGALGFPIFWGLAIVAPDFVGLVFGKRWMEAVPVIQAICISMPLKILGPIGPPALTAIGKPGVSGEDTAVGSINSPGFHRRRHPLGHCGGRRRMGVCNSGCIYHRSSAHLPCDPCPSQNHARANRRSGSFGLPYGRRSFYSGILSKE